VTLSWVHFISQRQTRSRKRTTVRICTTLQDTSIRNEKKGRKANGGIRVTLHVQACSSCKHIISLMRRPYTDSAPNNPVTLLRNQLLIRSWSRVPWSLSQLNSVPSVPLRIDSVSHLHSGKTCRHGFFAYLTSNLKLWICVAVGVSGC